MRPLPVVAARRRPVETATGTAPIGAADSDTAYDLIITGPNRFLRRFIGDIATVGKDLVARVTVQPGDPHARYPCRSQPPPTCG
jgi:hypothetical protein